MSALAVNCWLMKSEPDVFSIDDLERKAIAGWDGVRNYQARNFMRAMKTGDLILFYHSNARPPGAAGTAEVCRTAYPDPTQFDPDDGHFDSKATREKPIWFQVDVRFSGKFTRFLPLEELRRIPELKNMTLFQRSRLSVQPLTFPQWKIITARGMNG